MTDVAYLIGGCRTIDSIESETPLGLFRLRGEKKEMEISEMRIRSDDLVQKGRLRAQIINEKNVISKFMSSYVLHSFY